MFHLETLLKDLRYAARTYAKNPGFAAVAVLTLALGIGANSAMFSIVYAILLKPLPYSNPQELVSLTHYIPLFRAEMASSIDYWEWRDQTQLFQDVAASRTTDYNLIGGSMDRGVEPERVQAIGVSANFFRTLGLHTAIGRTFTEDEDKPGGPQVAILTHALFARRYASNPAIVGQTIQLDEKPYMVVGVMSAEARFPQGLDVSLLTPMQLAHESMTSDHGISLVGVIARLRPGLAMGRVRADLNRVYQRSPNYNPKDPTELRVTPLHARLVGDRQTALFVLLGAVGLVLLIACGNVANLLLARASGRRREIAMRAALGAPRSRVVRQLLSESLLLSIAGAALGLVFARAAIKTFIALGEKRIPFIENTSINWVVLAFTAGAAILTGILFGLVPALAISKTDVIEALKQSGQSATPSAAQRRFRGLLVACEIAVALVLLIGASLLIKSLWILQSLDPGFRPDHVLSVDINPLPSRYGTKEQQLAFFNDVISRITALPGVEAAGIYKDRYIAGIFQIPGHPAAASGRSPIGEQYPVTPGYFRALGMHLVRGRFIDSRDGPDAPLSVDINETMAKRYFTGEDPIGRQIKWGRVFNIVGIVADASDNGPGVEVPAMMYVAAAQAPSIPTMHLLVRAAGNPVAIASVIRDQIRGIDRDQPIYNVQTMEQKLSSTIAPRRFSMILLSVFASLALILAVVGIYAVMYSSVVQRTHEIGIRMALGAGRRDVMRMIAVEAAGLAMLGLILGLSGAWAATRLLKSMLYNVSTTDPWMFGLVPLALFLAAMAASFLPARRATEVDPLVALRQE